MEIKWHGNSCFTISGKKGTIIINPDAQAGKLKGDIVFSSLREGLVDVEGQKKVFDWPGEYEVGGIPIIGFEAHTKSKSQENEEDIASPTIIFYFEIDKIKCCHMGALGHSLQSETIKDLADVNVLMISAGEGSNLSIKKAEEIIEAIDPNVLIPMGETPEEFLKSRDLEKVEAIPKFVVKSRKDLPENERQELKMKKV